MWSNLKRVALDKGTRGWLYSTHHPLSEQIVTAINGFIPLAAIIRYPKG
jgi:hypothetical protein